MPPHRQAGLSMQIFVGAVSGNRIPIIGELLCADHRKRLANFASFSKADKPKFIARHAVSLDRIAAVEQSQQVRDGKRVLWLFALAARACRYEDDGLSQGATFLPDVRQPSL